MNLYFVYVINIRFVCDGEIYLLTYLLTDLLTYLLTSLLSKPACRLLEPIKIDYNFIEVSDRFCLDIEEKKFIRNPRRLKESPRA